MNRPMLAFAVVGWIVAGAVLVIRIDGPASASPLVSSAVHSSCAADTDGNGIVNVTDLLNLLATWGECPDSDGDGWTIADGDCDDDDASINPGAPEVCDGVDNNCDNVVDENNPTAPTWYIDSDSDGYGDAGTLIQQCDQPDGYVDNSFDCDDADSSIYPGADEFCDFIDNDCDGQIDENPVDGTTWYRDDDGDGYGDSADTTVQCEQPVGYVAQDGDCDDSDFTIHPEADELCDGIDNNCNGTVDEGC